MIALPGDKFIAAGAFQTYNNVVSRGIVKLNADLSQDLTFTSYSDTIMYLFSAAQQSDGKFILGGKIFKYDGQPVYNLIRILNDGKLDTSFHVSILNENNGVSAIAIQPDGKIIIGGSFTMVNGVLKKYLARLNTNGSLDNTFNTGFSITGFYPINKILIDGDGKILIAGSFTTTGTVRNNLARLNSDGSVDATFTTGTGPDGEVTELVVDAGGRYLIGGYFNSYNGNAVQYMARISSGGIYDNTFTVPVSGMPVPVYSISFSGTDVFVGGGYNNPGGLLKLNDAGIQDMSFLAPSPVVKDLIILPDEKIIACGDFNLFNLEFRGNLVKLNADGSLDASLDPPGGSTATITDISRLSDGNYLITNMSGYYDDSHSRSLSKIFSDGSADQAFNTGTGPNANIDFVESTSDNKAYLLGNGVSSYNGNAINKIARINADGSFDAGFNVPVSISFGFLWGIKTASGNKLYVYGDAITYGATTTRVIRLKTNGTRDMAFNVTISSGTVYDLFVQPDGKIMIAGNFGAVNGVATDCVARLNSDGTIDATFNSTSLNIIGNGVFSIKMQADGKYVAGGQFTMIGSTLKNLIRIKSNGTIDNTFTTAAEINFGSLIKEVEIQPDGKIWACGDFNSYAGTPVAGLVRLGTSGSIDPVFMKSTPNFFSANMWGSELSPSGKIYCFGSFTNYLDKSFGDIARLNAYDVCEVPSAIYADELGTNKATIHWTGDADATKYKVQYRQLGIATWTTVNTTAVFKKLTGLAAATTYEYRVQTICAFGSSAYSAIQTFTTLPLKTAENETEISIFPNPNNGQFELFLNTEIFPGQIEIYNSAGARILSATVFEKYSVFDLGDCAAGIYFVKIINGPDMIHTAIVVE